jgi:exopolyphosphatase/guanosine-5'-triphosphate,3'-diphosphate pyrophosphatase
LISIGTNSTRLLVAEIAPEGIAPLAHDSRGTRLGANLRESGPLDPQARDRTLEAIDAYVVVAKRYDAQISVIATSAMRRASDGAAFAAEIAEHTGAAPRVLDGNEEATYSYLGATAAFADADLVVGVLDVGGGSTEYASDVPSRARGKLATTMSLEIGAVRLGEAVPALLGGMALDVAARAEAIARARAHAEAILAPLAAQPAPERLLAVGGTVVTAGLMLHGHGDGATLTGLERRKLIDDLLARSLAERIEMPGIRPQRADILPAGLIIVDAAAAALRCDAMTISLSDLLAGYLRATS